MATRNISTRLAVEGESQYKAAISSINAELKNMQSALKMTESEFKNNATSAEALTAKGKALENLLASQKNKVAALEAGLKNARDAEARYAQKKEELTRKIQANNAALDKLRNSTEDTTKEEKQLEEENARLSKELEKNEEYLNAAHRAVNNWETSLNKAKTDVNNTEDAIRQNSDALNQNSDAAEKDADAIDALAVALIASGLKRGLEEVAGALRACVDASVEFESGMAGVKRTVGGSDEYISQLGESFKEMSSSMPITTAELAKIAETAGQLGIKQENVESFTAVMAQLATTTDLTAENAATMLAQFSNITGVTDYERLGSVIAELGDATATTASKVVDMSQGMAAAASIAGMSERDILAISAAVGSLGIEAQAGSTAMSTLISNIYKATETGGDKLDAFASVANMSASEFRQAWQDDAVGALDAFIRGLNDTERNGKSAIMLLDDLGITNVRQTKAILGLASAGDLLTTTIAKANSAWEKNTALSEKAAIMYGTTEAKITMYKNSVNNLKVAVGDQLTPALADMAEKGTDAVQWATEFVKENEWLGPVIASVATALATLTVVVGGTAVAIKVLQAAVALFNGTLLACPAFWVVAALAAVTAAAIALAKTLPSATKEADKLNKALDESKESVTNAKQAFDDTQVTIDATSSMVSRYIDRLDELNKKSELTSHEQGEYNAIVAQLQNLLPEVNIKMDETGERLATTTDELREGARAWEEYARQQAFATIWQEQVTTLNSLGLELEKARMKMAEYTASSSEGVIKYAEAYKDLLKAEEEYHRVGEEHGYAQEIEEVSTALEAYNQAKDKAKAASKGLSREEKATAVEMGALALAIENTEAEFDAQTEAVDAAEKAFKDYQAACNDVAAQAAEMGSEADAAAFVQKKAAERIKGELQDLAQAYKDAYDSARESLDGQIGLWDEMENKVTSADALQTAVDSQIAYLQNYAANMESLLSRNIEGIEEFAKNFTDGSAESAAALAGLASASDAEIQNIMNSLSQVDTYKDNLSSMFAALETDLTGSLENLKTEYANAIEEISGAGDNIDFSGFVSAVDSAFSSVGVQFQTIGADAGAGLAAGLESSTGEAESQATAMGQAVVDAVREALDSHSPSVVMTEIGHGVGEGLAQGIEESTSDASSAIQTMGQVLEENMQQVGLDSVKAFEQELSKAADVAKKSISQANQSVRSLSGDARSAGYSVGAAIAQGAAAGVRAYAAQVAAEAAAMVREAIAAAKREAESASPSKKMIRLGRDIDEGLIIGIKELTADVARQMKDTMSNVTTFQVDIPEIPNYADSILRMMDGPRARSTEGETLRLLRDIDKKMSNVRNIYNTQNIYAEDTSYAGQQREAQRRLREISRELSRA